MNLAAIRAARERIADGIVATPVGYRLSAIGYQPDRVAHSLARRPARSPPPGPDR